MPDSRVRPLVPPRERRARGPTALRGPAPIVYDVGYRGYCIEKPVYRLRDNDCKRTPQGCGGHRDPTAADRHSGRILFPQFTDRLLAGLDILKHAKFPKLFTEEVLARVAKQIHQEAIDVKNLTIFGIHNEDAIMGGFKKPPIASLGYLDLLFRRPPFGDVTKDQDYSGNLACLVADGRSAVVNGMFRSIAGDE